MELFDYLKALTVDKTELDFETEEIRKDYLPFLINRFVSMTEIFVPIVNEINQYDVPKSAHYQYYLAVLPKRKQYFKYIKKAKDISEDEKKILANYFEVGLKDAERFIQVLDESQIKEIVDMHRYGKNQLAGL